MGTKRRVTETHPSLLVSGEGADKKVVSVSAGVAIALDRAHKAAVGAVVVLFEWGEELGRAVRLETHAEWRWR